MWEDRREKKMSFPDEQAGGAIEWAGPERPYRNPMKGPGSTVSSGPSMRSDWSKDRPPNLTGEGKSCTSKDSGYSPSLSASSVSSGRALCDVCSDTAVKTCLTCMASYCERHVKDHYTSPDLERHQLQDLPHQERCEQHNKKLRLYCRTDESAICFHCFLHNHNGHDVIEQNPQETQSKSLIRHGVPPPGQIQFTSVKPNSLTVSWSPPEGAPRPHRYKITRRQGQEQRSITVAGLSLKVTDLIPGETYHFSVTTLSKDGRQSTCVERSVQTEVPPPENITVKPSLGTASLMWTKPAGVGQVSYLLELCRNKEPIDTIQTDSHQYTITDLQPATDYIISIVTVVNSGNQSRPTSKNFTTEVPPPENFTVNPTPQTASMTWTKPAGVGQVFYLLKLCVGTQGHIPVAMLETDTHQTTIPGLQPRRVYTISIVTVLNNGNQSRPTSKTFATPSIWMGFENMW